MLANTCFQELVGKTLFYLANKATSQPTGKSVPSVIQTAGAKHVHRVIYVHSASKDITCPTEGVCSVTLLAEPAIPMFLAQAVHEGFASTHLQNASPAAHRTVSHALSKMSVSNAHQHITCKIATDHVFGYSNHFLSKTVHDMRVISIVPSLLCMEVARFCVELVQMGHTLTYKQIHVWHVLYYVIPVRECIDRQSA